MSTLPHSDFVPNFGSLVQTGTAHDPIREVFLRAPAAIAMLSGPEHRFVFVNHHCVRLFGRKSADEILNKPVRDALPELRDQPFFDLMDQVYQTGQDFVGNEVLVPFDREGSGQTSEAYFNFIYQPTRDARGKIDGILATGIEITDQVVARKVVEDNKNLLEQQKHALEHSLSKLLENEERLRNLADNITQFAWMADPSGWIFWYNRRWYEYTGTTLEEMQGWGWTKVHHPHHLDRVVKRLQLSWDTGEPWEDTFPLRGKDGNYRWFLSRAVPIRDDYGNIARWFGTNTDITEQWEAEDEARQSAEKLRFMMESMPQKVFTTRANGEVDYFNGQWTVYTGLSFKEIKDWGWMQFIHPEDIEKTVRLWLLSVETGEPFQLEHRFRRADGEYRWHLGRANALRDNSGNIVMWIGSNTDIHDQKLGEEALRKNEKLAVVGRLAATISHEINNPLEAVSNLVYLMKNESSTEGMRTYIQLAEQELARIAHVVTHSLRFNRQSTRRTEEKLSELLDSAAAIYQGRLKGAGIDLRRDYRDSSSLVCFASELRQVFAHLIANAFDATRRGGQIVLRTRQGTVRETGKSFVRVTVADTGHGMDQKTMQHLFDPFVTTKGIHGNGLGLWVSADMLKNHSATVRVRSRRTKVTHPTLATTGKEDNREAKDGEANNGNLCGTVFHLVFPLNADLDESSG